MTNELYHHGILGQKWGVRRYQNTDGSLKPNAKGRYSRSQVKQYRKMASEYNRTWDEKRDELRSTEMYTSNQYNRKAKEFADKKFIEKYGETSFKDFTKMDKHFIEKEEKADAFALKFYGAVVVASGIYLAADYAKFKMR